MLYYVNLGFKNICNRSNVVTSVAPSVFIPVHCVILGVCVCVQEHCKSGEALLKRLEKWEDISSAELQVYEVKVRSFWVHLHDFSQRVEETKDKIDKTVRLYEFFDKVSGQ